MAVFLSGRGRLMRPLGKGTRDTLTRGEVIIDETGWRAQQLGLGMPKVVLQSAPSGVQLGMEADFTQFGIKAIF